MQAINRIKSITSHLIVGGDVWKRINTSPDAVNVTPLNVCITGAAGQLAYSLIFSVTAGRMFGPYQPVNLRLLDIPKMLDSMKGIVMELEDCAFPLLSGVVATASPAEAFKDVNVVLMLGAFPRGPGMERKDLLKLNTNIFKEQGQALDQFAARDVKVVVVGNPANTNCLTLKTHAPTLPANCFSALTRLDQNRAVSYVASKLNVPVNDVDNVIIWGNHSNTQYPDYTHAIVRDAKGAPSSVSSAIQDSEWQQKVFIPQVQQRGLEVIRQRKTGSAASAAKAVVDHTHSWLFGTSSGEYVSMAVTSDGSYGVPSGLISSFPVTCKGGEFKIVDNLSIDAFSRTMIDKTVQELVEERAIASSYYSARP